MKRVILVILVLAIAIGGYYAYRLYTDRTPDIVDQQADFVISASQLVAAFNKDTAAAARTYVDKLVEVQGEIKSVDTSALAVVMNAGGGQSAVRFGLDRRHSQDVQVLKAGTTAVLQGRVTGYDKGEEMLGVSLGTTITISFAGLKKK